MFKKNFRELQFCSYNDSLANTTNDRALRLKVLHKMTIRSAAIRPQVRNKQRQSRGK